MEKIIAQLTAQIQVLDNLLRDNDLQSKRILECIIELEKIREELKTNG